MQKDEILSLYRSFLDSYDPEERDAIWQLNSRKFREFWNERVLKDDGEDISDVESDEIIKILDRNGKGNTKESEAAARAMIAQGVWRRMFNDIKSKKEISRALNNIFLEHDLNKKAELIDELYVLNEKNKNSLTGPGGNAINCLIFAFNPGSHLSVVSLKDRKKVIDYFSFESSVDFEKDTPGKKIVFSNEDILRGFRGIGIDSSPRTISWFLYSPNVRDLWKKDDDDYAPWGGVKNRVIEESSEIVNPALFYMESQLEDFLIENWDKTELGSKYDLIEEDGELVSQQYKTDIGRIDILAQDKKTKQYVVIELKKNQTSDDTVGQIARYMGWLEDHKTNGKSVKGVIIAAQYDERLHYALKKVNDIEVYLYRIDFKLAEFIK
jgi:hypothetical protein